MHYTKVDSRYIRVLMTVLLEYMRRLNQTLTVHAVYTKIRTDLRGTSLRGSTMTGMVFLVKSSMRQLSVGSIIGFSLH